MEVGMAFSFVTFLLSQMQFFESRQGTLAATKEQLSRLDQIEKLAECISAQARDVGDLLSELPEGRQLSDISENIWAMYHEYSSHTRNNAPYQIRSWWGEKVVRPHKGLPKSLAIMHDLITRSSVLDIFRTEAETAIHDGKLRRSTVGAVMHFFNKFFLEQAIGYLVLGEAYRVRREWTQADYVYRARVTRMNSQLAHAHAFLEPLPLCCYENRQYGQVRRKDFMYVSDSPLVDIGGICKADYEQNYVVVGLKFFRFRNRIALQIRQAKTKLIGTVDKNSVSWVKPTNPNGRKNADFMDINARESHFVDLHMVTVPEGEVVVGARLYQKGNRLGVKLLSARIKMDSGHVVASSAHWVENRATGDRQDYDFLDTWRDKHADLHDVTPKPMTWITGAGLYKKGNRFALRVRDASLFQVNGVACSAHPYYLLSKGTRNLSCCGGYIMDNSSRRCSRNLPLLRLP